MKIALFQNLVDSPKNNPPTKSNKPLGYQNKTNHKPVITSKIYDLIITWDNPVNYYAGFTEQFEILENYYINNNSELSVSKDDNCYIKIRLIFDDGGWEVLNEHLIIWVHGKKMIEPQYQ